MKAILVLLLLGLIGYGGWYYIQHTHNNPPPAKQVENFADKARNAVVNVKDAVVNKVQDWKLEPSDIKDELEKTGRIVRDKVQDVGEHFDDARVVAVVKGKYAVESGLSAFDIKVDCRDGAVVLSGSVKSAENIGRAVSLALDTNGVHQVVSQLVVKN